jgi:hypothetical protein
VGLKVRLGSGRACKLRREKERRRQIRSVLIRPIIQYYTNIIKEFV